MKYPLSSYHQIHPFKLNEILFDVVELNAMIDLTLLLCRVYDCKVVVSQYAFLQNGKFRIDWTLMRFIAVNYTLIKFYHETSHLDVLLTCLMLQQSF